MCCYGEVEWFLRNSHKMCVREKLVSRYYRDLCGAQTIDTGSGYECRAARAKLLCAESASIADNVRKAVG